MGINWPVRPRVVESGYKNKPLQSRDLHICHFIWRNKHDSTHVIKGRQKGHHFVFCPFLIYHVCLMLLHMYVTFTSHYCFQSKCNQYDLSCRWALKHYSFIHSFILTQISSQSVLFPMFTTQSGDIADMAFTHPIAAGKIFSFSSTNH